MNVDLVPPAWTVGPGRRFRLTASAVAERHSPYGCPARTALGARQRARSLQPRDPLRWRRQWDDADRLTFTIRDALWLVLDKGYDVATAAAADSRATAAQRRFLAHALAQALRLPDEASRQAGVTLRFGPEVSYLDGDGDEVGAFGAHLVSPDGQVREVVRLRRGRVKGADDPGCGDFVAVAAWALARGTHPEFAGAPQRVRVSELSLHDGGYLVLFDGSVEEAEQAYRAAGDPVAAALSDLTLNPGSGCADCAFLNVCPAVPQHRGALGIPRRAVATRALTAADLASYARCPTAFHVQRRDHLPPAPPEGAGDEGAAWRLRGLAAHAWLRWAHQRTPRAGCREDDLPDPVTDPAAAEVAARAAGLSWDGYQLAWPYLRQHVLGGHCLLGYAGLTDWAVEPRHTVFDPDADVVVVSSPDLTLRVGAGAPVWRETKTAHRLPPDVVAALHAYPAFALDVALLAAGVGGGGGQDGAVELEVLTPTTGAVFVVSLADGALVAEAARLVAGIAQAFAADLVFAPRPSGACRFCDAYGWCQPGAVPAGPSAGPSAGPPDIDDAEFAGHPDPF